jgi:hypothetical protein
LGPALDSRRRSRPQKGWGGNLWMKKVQRQWRESRQKVTRERLGSDQASHQGWFSRLPTISPADLHSLRALGTPSANPWLVLLAAGMGGAGGTPADAYQDWHTSGSRSLPTSLARGVGAAIGCGARGEGKEKWPRSQVSCHVPPAEGHRRPGLPLSFVVKTLAGANSTHSRYLGTVVPGTLSCTGSLGLP